MDRGYSVAEVSERLGVSAHSLYKWVKAIKPDKTDEQAAALIESRSEVLKLRARLKRTEEERDILKKAARYFCSKPRVKYRFIHEHRGEHAVQVMCRLLEVSPSGFYEWVKRPLSDRAIEDRRLLVLIRASNTASGGVYGYRRVHLDLCEIGEACGKHRVARIMRTNHIKARHGYKTPRGIYGRPSIIAPNKLQREFTVDRPDRAWVTDITYSAPSLGRRLDDAA